MVIRLCTKIKNILRAIPGTDGIKKKFHIRTAYLRIIIAGRCSVCGPKNTCNYTFSLVCNYPLTSGVHLGPTQSRYMVQVSISHRGHTLGLAEHTHYNVITAFITGIMNLAIPVAWAVRCTHL